MFKQNKAYVLSELVDGLEVTIQGDPHCLIHGVASIQQAESGQIAFLANRLYKKYLATTHATAVILNKNEAPGCLSTAVISANPYYVYAKVAARFVQATPHRTGCHSSVTLGTHCSIAASAVLHPHCVIGNNVCIEDYVVIGAGCVIGDFSVIGRETQLDGHVTLYPRTKIGQRSHLASGVVIGSDGFGFAAEKGQWHRVPQLGSVVIGNEVDIGANTTIDRGALDDTIIEDGVKLDNLIQVGHNVRIGAHTIIAGCVAIAGSTVIGKNCIVGGATCFAGHIQICDNAVITGMTAVTKSISDPGIYSSGIVGAVPNYEFRKNNARFHRLENLMQRVKNLESALKAMTERDSK